MQQRKAPKTERKSRYAQADEEVAKKLKPLVPLTEKQRHLITALQEKSQVFTIGSSGTGKTYVPAMYAAQQYLIGNFKRIMVTRPNVASGPDLGYFKGTLDEKLEPWVYPVHEILVDVLGENKVVTDMKNGNIMYVPLSVMRGRSYKDTFVIVDEAQNITLHQLKMLLTRIGHGSKLVLNGDVKQTDLKSSSSGLATVVGLAKKYNLGIPVIEFTTDDIVRGDICKQWAIIFDEEGI